MSEIPSWNTRYKFKEQEKSDHWQLRKGTAATILHYCSKMIWETSEVSEVTLKISLSRVDKNLYILWLSINCLRNRTSTNEITQKELQRLEETSSEHWVQPPCYVQVPLLLVLLVHTIKKSLASFICLALPLRYLQALIRTLLFPRLNGPRLFSLSS